MVRNALILSDIHLGASSSLLTAIDYDPDTDTPVNRPLADAILDRLIADVREMLPGGKIHQCILLGDIFDFSFAPYGLAMQNGRWFFQKLHEANLFEEYVYIPGNHDHHLWQQISEHYYLMTELENPPLSYPHTLPANFLLENTFLDRLLPEGIGIQVTYPNYTFQIHGHPFYLHHGHYLQKLYVVASRFLEETLHTNTIEDLEVLNSPFLEFGWYNIGQAYNIGKDKLIDRLYFLFKNHNTAELDRLLKAILQKIDRWEGGSTRHRRWNPAGMATDTFIKLLGPYLLKRLFFKHSRLFHKRQPASSVRHERLAGGTLHTSVIEYIQKYMLSEEPCEACTFIFGHTHEPEDNFLCADDTGVCYHIYNTGGWIADQWDDVGNLVLPRMAPIYVGEDGSVNPIPFTEAHADFLREQLAADPAFQRLRGRLKGG